jgi:hypothetical protein
MPGALQADELGNVFEVLAEDVLIASGEHRHGTRAKLEQPVFPGGIVLYVNRGKVDALFRKKLFRSEATASAGLCEQNEIVVDGFHEKDKLRRRYQRRALQASTQAADLQSACSGSIF